MIKNKKVLYALFVVLFVVFWYLLSFLWNTFITKNGFKFELGFDFATTAVLAAAVGYMLILREKKKPDAEEKED